MAGAMVENSTVYHAILFSAFQNPSPVKMENGREFQYHVNRAFFCIKLHMVAETSDGPWLKLTGALCAVIPTGTLSSKFWKNASTPARPLSPLLTSCWS